MGRTTAIILAAGQGKRMNTSVAKQYLELEGRPVVYYALKAFEESTVDDIILVAGEGQADYCKENVVDKYSIAKVSAVIEGGKERCDSVYRALKAIGEAEYVLIHDGARPFVSGELIESSIKFVRESGACILGTPVKETIKAANEQGFISQTPDRRYLWAAQTPQTFRYSEILYAYDLLYREDIDLRRSVTDDAMVYEMFIKKQIKILMGDYNNFKITTPEDYERACHRRHNML